MTHKPGHISYAQRQAVKAYLSHCPPALPRPSARQLAHESGHELIVGCVVMVAGLLSSVLACRFDCNAALVLGLGMMIAGLWHVVALEGVGRGKP